MSFSGVAEVGSRLVVTRATGASPQRPAGSLPREQRRQQSADGRPCDAWCGLPWAGRRQERGCRSGGSAAEPKRHPRQSRLVILRQRVACRCQSPPARHRADHRMRHASADDAGPGGRRPMPSSDERNRANHWRGIANPAPALQLLKLLLVPHRVWGQANSGRASLGLFFDPE